MTLPESLWEFDRQFYERGVRLLCGVDEAGRGPLAGPVVAAAVVFTSEIRIPRVDDSKKLSPRLRESLYDEIADAAHTFAAGIVDNLQIDRINILAATHMAARQAIEQLGDRPDLIITDYLALKNTPAPVESFVRGDARSHAIAAASIIAKVTRDRLMMEYHARYPEYNFAGNKGYGTKEHIEALKRHGPSPIHRFTFRPLSDWGERLGSDPPLTYT
ncbi:MAG TPA: ribonuclease HII [Candidatus Sumerlaeota bacterium]|nr:ribonuclease HII [Candidatus Sumerlaeota bacterium]